MASEDFVKPQMEGVTPVAELSYEQARDELAGLVQLLEAGNLNLDQSLAMWERGEELANYCQELLSGARQRIEAATGGSTEPAAPPA